MCTMHLARALSVAMTYDICTVNQAIHSHARTSPSTVENWQPGTLHAAMEILAAAHMQTSYNHSTPHCTDNSKNSNIATKQQQSHNQIWLQNTKKRGDSLVCAEEANISELCLLACKKRCWSSELMPCR